ncbi:putative PEP-binding protein [Vibrio genomosp. F10]|uniref:putative PEP-binding protein n=1 Tax=Vibrio genomosp. F10 TaxID=723171 RepID=UPI00037D8664|nr:putative PEP-binding protein [Vibrio genomosp. F10]OEE97871.1 phosphoenolpyruvate synthase [Vibrio genomosp. F10 str. 9ZC157]OEF05143.1 phosphoenolpyruvate synthase [Vibrio genomosp. F10 str. 9ZB36]
MSLPNNNSLVSGLTLGDAFPSSQLQTNGQHIYVSLTELIMDKVFYHPSLVDGNNALSDLEQTSLDAILAGESVQNHFVSSLCTQIESAIKETHTNVRICLSGGDSDAFRSLIAGKIEEKEANPALGARGVIRFASSFYASAFALECQVIKSLREKGIDVEIIVPFVRTLADAATIIDKLAEQGLPRGLNGLKVLFSVDVPSSVLLAERLLHYFDGAAIHLENLAQFTLGIDRTSEKLENSFDVDNEAVIQLIDMMVKGASTSKKPLLFIAHAIEENKKLHHYLLENNALEIVVTG